jgi:hypothetical protein
MGKSTKVKADEKVKGGRGVKTTYFNFVAMVEWLEVEPGNNFRLVTGDASSTMTTVIAGAKLKKRDAYVAIADWVNQKCSTKWTCESAEARYKAYLKQYKETNREFNNKNEAKFCLGVSDLTNNVTTIDGKLEKMCPLYSRMDKLFGGKQNVIPSYVLQSGTSSKVVATLLLDSVCEDAAEDEENHPPDSDYDDDNSVANDDAVTTTTKKHQTSFASPAEHSSFKKCESLSTSVVSSVTAVSDKKKVKSSAPNTPVLGADLRSMCEESVNAANSDPVEKVSFGKKRKDFASVYADSRIQEMSLARDRFEWDRLNHDSEQLAREKAAERAMAEDTERFKLTLAAEHKKSIIAEGIRAGKSAEEIKLLMELLLN